MITNRRMIMYWAMQGIEIQLSNACERWFPCPTEKDRAKIEALQIKWNDLFEALRDDSELDFVSDCELYDLACFYWGTRREDPRWPSVLETDLQRSREAIAEQEENF